MKDKGLWFWANAYKVSLTVFALYEAGALQRIAGNAATAPQLASELGLSEEALTPLLDILATHGVVTRNDNEYRLTDSETLLPLIAHESAMHGAQITRDGIIEVLKGGNGSDPMDSPQSFRYWPRFLAAMAVSARTLAPHLVRFANFREGHFLDLGGADGTLAANVLRLVKNLSITVVDRAVLEPAFERTRKTSESDRLSFHGTDVGRPDDLAELLHNAHGVIISNVLHVLRPERRMDLLRTVFEHLRPGLPLIIYDQFIETGNASDTAQLMVVDWLLCGGQFDLTETAFAAELRRVGFTIDEIRRIDAIPGALLRASRK